MESREALRKLRTRRSPGSGGGSASSDNPLSQLLRGIFALLAPVCIVYYGNHFLSRSSADTFSRHFIEEFVARRTGSIHADMTLEGFQQREDKNAFTTRAQWVDRTFGRLVSLDLEHFKVELIGGAAEIRYVGNFSGKRAKISLILASQSRSAWKVADFKFEEG